MDISKKKIHITQLLLDTENPRHDVLQNQTEIIKELLKNQKIENLAKDIAKHGSLNPLDMVGVLESENQEYIVIEGNRRVCACMLLNNPTLCPDKNTKSRISKIKKTGSAPVELECAVFEDREAADHWIKLRHEGQQDGVGTKEWNTQQQTRYAMKMGRSNPNDQSLLLLDYAVNKEIIDLEDRDDYKITTLKRYLGSPVVRNVFGLTNNHNLKSKQVEPTFIELVDQFLRDYKDEIVHSRSNKHQRADYANELQRKIAPPPPSDNPVVDYGDNSFKDNKKKPRKRSKRDPLKRPYLVGSIFSISDNLLNGVYHELKRTKIEYHELSVAYLFRAFIERMAVLYLKKHLPGKLGTESKLNAKLKWISEDLKDKKSVEPKKLNTLNIAASSQNSKLSPLVFGMMVHLSHLPSKRELIQMWGSWEETLHLIHGYIE